MASRRPSAVRASWVPLLRGEPSLTLYQRPEIYVCKESLANFGAFGFASPLVYEDIGWANSP